MNRRFFGKIAFTISEVLVALGIVAILTAVLIPIINSLIPDQHALMAKRAFYTMETIVHGLLNDTGCYPPTRVRSGFGDGKGYRRCTLYPQDKPESPSEKFKTLFLDKLDINGTITNNGRESTFSTKEGMYWVITVANDGSATVTVDVNGPNRRPNCGQSETSRICTGEDEGRQKGFDTFTVNINVNGQMSIEDCWAILAVRTDKKLLGNQPVDEDLCNGEYVVTPGEPHPDEENPDDPAAPDNSCTENHVPSGPDDACCASGVYDTNYQYKCNACYPVDLSKTDTCCNTYKNPEWHSELTAEIKSTCCTLTSDNYFCSNNLCSELKLANVSDACCNYWQSHPEIYTLDAAYQAACDTTDDQDCIEDRKLDEWGTDNPCNFVIPVAFRVTPYKYSASNSSLRAFRLSDLGTGHYPETTSDSPYSNNTILGDVYTKTANYCSGMGAHIVNTEDLDRIYECSHYNRCGRHPKGSFGTDSQGRLTYGITPAGNAYTTTNTGKTIPTIHYNWGIQNYHSEIIGGLDLDLDTSWNGSKYLIISPPRSATCNNYCYAYSSTSNSTNFWNYDIIFTCETSGSVCLPRECTGTSGSLTQDQRYVCIKDK